MKGFLVSPYTMVNMMTPEELEEAADYTHQALEGSRSAMVVAEMRRTIPAKSAITKHFCGHIGYPRPQDDIQKSTSSAIWVYVLFHRISY